jgi:hypothetical protein
MNVTVKVIRNRKSGDNYPTRLAQPLPPSSPVHYWMPLHTVPIHSSAHVRRAVFRLRVESGVTAGNYMRIKHDFVKTCHFEPRISRTAFFPACLRFSRIPGRWTPATRVTGQKSFRCQKITSSRKVPSRGVESDIHPIYVLVWGPRQHSG